MEGDYTPMNGCGRISRRARAIAHFYPVLGRQNAKQFAAHEAGADPPSRAASHCRKRGGKRRRDAASSRLHLLTNPILWVLCGGKKCVHGCDLCLTRNGIAIPPRRTGSIRRWLASDSKSEPGTAKVLSGR